MPLAENLEMKIRVSRFLKAIYGAQVEIWGEKTQYCLSSRCDELKLD